MEDQFSLTRPNERVYRWSLAKFVAFIGFSSILLIAILYVGSNEPFSQRMEQNPNEQQADKTKLDLPFLDMKKYRLVQLDNGIKTILVSNPAADDSAMVIGVKTGSMYDPKELPGLAHFLEHSVFLGSENYPMEGMTQKVLSSFGGGENAMTAPEITTFFFGVSNEGFTQVGHMFADFIRAPLLRDASLDREVSAVDSEYTNDLGSDDWQLHRMIMLLANQSHPMTQFTVGSIDTLKN